MDTTLGYILCTQSPGLFLAAVMLLLFYFARRREHHVRAVMDLVLCIVCAAGGVALYFVGMGAGHFTIQDFYAIRMPGWIGMRGGGHQRLAGDPGLPGGEPPPHGGEERQPRRQSPGHAGGAGAQGR